MSKQIFVNLPVKDLAKSTSFYEGLGFKKDATFSDDNASCLVLTEHIYVMLLRESFYQQFVPGKQITNAKTHSEVGLCISCDSREEVQTFADRAQQLGGRVYSVDINTQNEGMFGLSVEDLDGHLWEPLWMDMEAFTKQMQTNA